MCWTFVDGGVAVTGGVHSTAEAPRAVVAVDDRDDRCSPWTVRHGKSGFVSRTGWESVDRHRVTTRSLLSVAPSVAPGAVEEVELEPDWQAIMDEAVSDAERDLIRALADAGVAVPVLGYETDSGEVIDFAWAGARIGVVFDDGATADGWTLCPADVPQIVAALTSNGVM